MLYIWRNISHPASENAKKQNYDSDLCKVFTIPRFTTFYLKETTAGRQSSDCDNACNAPEVDEGNGDRSGER